HLHGHPQRRRAGRGAGHQPDAQQAAGLHAVGVLRGHGGWPVRRFRPFPRPGPGGRGAHVRHDHVHAGRRAGHAARPPARRPDHPLADAVPAVPAGVPLHRVRADPGGAGDLPAARHRRHVPGLARSACGAGRGAGPGAQARSGAQGRGAARRQPCL
ncbi:MAG: Branched-chain amino acid transport system permease protein LivM, partial [uncultured Ramlibacter sp.]